AGDQPHCRHPLIQSQGRVFHHRAGLQGELATVVVHCALPAIVLWLKDYLVATAPWASDAIRPAAGGHVFVAILLIGEVKYRLLKGAGFGRHELSMPERDGVVKYIYATVFFEAEGRLLEAGR